MGGPSSERDVSLATGHGISKALRSLGADVVEVDVRHATFKLPDDVDLAFIALHGTFGEDGQVQQILEERGVVYTGEGVEESRLAFDKIRSKEKFREHGVSTPEWEVIEAHQRPRMQLPIVVKAPRQGSTVGIYIVKKAEDLESAIADAAKYDRELLIEKFVPGRELTIGILGDQVLPILEIIPKGGFYDFTNKYPFLNPQAGGGAQHVCPAKLVQKSSRSRNRRVSNVRRRRQQHVLDVKVRSRRVTQHRIRRALVVLSRVVLVAGLSSAVYVGAREAARRLFFENRDYQLKTIELQTDGTLQREQVLKVADLREGENIF